MKIYIYSFPLARQSLRFLAAAGVFIFSFSLCKAQDTLVWTNGKKVVGKVVSVGKAKVVYSVPPDTVSKTVSNWRLKYIRYAGGTQINFNDKKPAPKPSTTEAYLSFDAGSGVPSLSYRDAIVGTHLGIRATYYFYNHVGITLLAAADLNSTGHMYISDNDLGAFYIFQQYLAGVTYRSGGKPSYPFVDFVGLVGVCNATSPTYEKGGGLNGNTVTTPGNGNGFGCYIGMDFTSSANHLCSLTFGLGVLGAIFSYPDYTSTFYLYDPYTNSTNKTISPSTLKTSLALFQAHFGINFRVKKAQR